jgi:endoglucanase
VRIAGAVVIVLAVLLLPAPAASAQNPLEGLSFYVDRESYASQASASNREFAVLAERPVFRWFGRFYPNLGRAVGKYIGAAKAAGQTPIMAVLRAESNKCSGGYSGGGPSEDHATMRWYEEFARLVGSERVVIAFEPDSLGTLDCLRRDRRDDRIRVLRHGVEMLSRLPNATIYLEASASDWEPAGLMAKLLRKIGVAKVRGFMLNVTHYDWTAANLRYGERLSRLLGGKHFVVNTSFNGRGPVHYRKRVNGRIRRINVYCHPLLRGLGPAPSNDTHSPHADAYLYINRPGLSGGPWHGGPLPVGTWWPERALELIRYRTDWLSPPPGTRYGLERHYTHRQLGSACTRRRPAGV